MSLSPTFDEEEYLSNELKTADPQYRQFILNKLSALDKKKKLASPMTTGEYGIPKKKKKSLLEMLSKKAPKNDQNTLYMQ